MRIYDGWLSLKDVRLLQVLTDSTMIFPQNIQTLSISRIYTVFYAVHNSTVVSAEHGLVNAESRILTLGLKIRAGVSS